MFHAGLFLFWQSKVKSGSLVRSSRGPNPPAVPVDDALNDGQAYAGAGELTGRVEPLEDREKAVGISHVEPGAIIANEKCAIRPVKAELDFWVGDLACELPGIAKKVFQKHAQEAFITRRVEFGCDYDFNIAKRLVFLHFSKDGLDQSTEVHPLELHLGAAQAG